MEEFYVATGKFWAEGKNELIYVRNLEKDGVITSLFNNKKNYAKVQSLITEARHNNNNFSQIWDSILALKLPKSEKFDYKPF